MGRLKDKVALITGAGVGMGRAAAILFAREGAKVVVNDFKKVPELHIRPEHRDLYRDGGEETVKLVKEAGGEAIYVDADASKKADVQRMIKTAVDTYGKIDVLYIQHGIGPSSRYIMKHVVDTSEEEWDAYVNIMLKGTYFCCKYGIPEMNDGGSIVITASIAALVGMRDPAYAAAKGGLLSLVKTIALGYGHRYIRANAILPGFIDTPMNQYLRDDPRMARQRSKAAPLGRIGTAEDVAKLALFLASDESSFITGQNFIIDGGITAISPHNVIPL